MGQLRQRLDEVGTLALLLAVGSMGHRARRPEVLTLLDDLAVALEPFLAPGLEVRRLPTDRRRFWIHYRSPGHAGAVCWTFPDLKRIDEAALRKGVSTFLGEAGTTSEHVPERHTEDLRRLGLLRLEVTTTSPTSWRITLTGAAATRSVDVRAQG